MTSGSCRSTTRMAEANESVSNPISRWSMAAMSSVCRYSTGSSMVTTWHERVWLMWSTIAASVVVLPEPVGPVTSTRPRISLARPVTDLGKPQLSDRGGAGPHPAHGQGRRSTAGSRH